MVPDIDRLAGRLAARPVRRFFATDDSRLPGRLAVAGVVAYTLAQLGFLMVGCDWDLCGDEAEYWSWSRRLDWSYYTRGPLIALMIRAGTALIGPLSLALTGSQAAAVRIPTLLVSVLTAWGLYRLARLVSRDRWAGLITILILPTVPMFRVGSLITTSDTPLLCCWVWAAVWSYRAIRDDDARAWLAAAALTAVGVWAKYTMLAFPASVGLYLLLDRTSRRTLIRPGFWLLAVGCVVGMAPIVYWNVHNGWAAANQMSSRLGLSTSYNWGIALPLLAFLGGDFAALGFWWPLELWVAGNALLGVVRATRRGSEVDEFERSSVLYLASLAAVILAACLTVSLMGETEANWSAPAHLALIVMLGRALTPTALGAPSIEAWLRRVQPCAVYWSIAFVGLTGLQHTEWFYPFVARVAPKATAENPAPLRRLDPTCRLRGYSELAPEVAARFAEVFADGGSPFVLTPTYTLASSLSFALPGQPDVYCLGWSPGMAAKALNQHDLWRPNPRHDLATFADRSAVVVEDVGRPPGFARGLVDLGIFREAGPTERIEIRRHGLVVGAWDVTVCKGYVGPRDAEPLRRIFEEYASRAYIAAHGGTLAGYVAGLYRDLLHRPPTVEETRYWSGILANQPREVVVERFARIGGKLDEMRRK